MKKNQRQKTSFTFFIFDSGFDLMKIQKPEQWLSACFMKKHLPLI